MKYKHYGSICPWNINITEVLVSEIKLLWQYYNHSKINILRILITEKNIMEVLIPEI